MNILYDDKDFVVFEKEPGIESEKITYRDVFEADTKRAESVENASGTINIESMESTERPENIANTAGKEKRLYCVHRLDKEVGGVTVYAKNEKTAAILSRGFADRTITKTYLALVEGVPEPEKGTMEDLLFHDRKTNKTYVVKRERRGVKKASLNYELVHVYSDEECRELLRKEENELSGMPDRYSLVRIHLNTGRTHQIRIQFASRKMPIVGDRRYGAKTTWNAGIALCSYELHMKHPFTEKELTIKSIYGISGIYK